MLRPLGILALAGLSFLAAQGTGIRLFFHLFYLLLALLALSYAWAWLNLRGLRVDSFNRIHWRSTARTGQLMVKEFELDPTAEIYVVLDMQERVQQHVAPE